MAMIDVSNSQGVEIKGGTFTQINNFTQKTPWDCLQSASAPSAFHDSGEDLDVLDSFPNSGVAVMDELRYFVSHCSNYGHARILWLNGPQDTERTAIARSLCEECSMNGFLLASFFFSRFDQFRNNHKRLVATIAYQICANIPKQYRHFILDVIEDDPLIFDRSIDAQFSALIITPLHNLLQASYFDMNSRCLIVIDNLHECLPTAAQMKFLGMIQDATGRLQAPLGFVITSRPDVAIQTFFKSSDLGLLLRQIHLSPFRFQTPADGTPPAKLSMANISRPPYRDSSNSTGSLPQYGRQTDSGYYESNSLAPQSQGLKTPFIFAEAARLAAEHLTPKDTAIEVEYHRGSPLSPFRNPDTTHVLGGRIPSSYPPISRNPSSWNDTRDLHPMFPEESLQGDIDTNIAPSHVQHRRPGTLLEGENGHCISANEVPPLLEQVPAARSQLIDTVSGLLHAFQLVYLPKERRRDDPNVPCR